MTLNIEKCAAEFDRAATAWHANAPVEENIGMAALRLIAAHALSVAPDATHMLMESSDQGNYMTLPMYLEKSGERIAEAEWDAHLEEHEDDLHPVASFLDWSSRYSDDGWETYADDDHPYNATKNGYYAMDLRRIAASTPAELPKPKIEILTVRDPDYATEVYMFVDGVEVDGYSEESVDPGAGYMLSDWKEHTEFVRNSKYSDAFKAKVIEAREGYNKNRYIEED